MKKKRNVLWVKTRHTNNLKSVTSLVMLWWLGISKKPSLSFHAFFPASSFSTQTFPLLMGMSKGLLFSLSVSVSDHRDAAEALRTSGCIWLAETPYGIPTRATTSGKTGQEDPYRGTWCFCSNAYIILPSIKFVVTLFCYQNTETQDPSLSSHTPSQPLSQPFLPFLC